MGMTIEQKIKTLLELYHFIKGDTHFCGYNEENATQSLETATETMRKYQKIKDIVINGDDVHYKLLMQIREIIGDENG